jgi:ABC-type transporter Mla MlaB component
LHFEGLVSLEKTLQFLTPRNDSRVNQLWWQIRLDALRILNQQEEFDAVAMDFCMLYELSPPSWVDAQCQLQDGGAHPAFEATRPPPTSSFGLDAVDTVVVELSGELAGDAAPALVELFARPISSDRLVVSCAGLVRVDFAAAGGILNWVTECELHGCRVQFTDVPRLIAGFFTVIGISEYAKVLLRSK